MNPRGILTPAREAALEALAAIRGGAPADEAVPAALAALGEAVSPADRGLANELVLGVLRHRRRLDAVVGRYAKKGLPKDEGVRDALRVAAFSLLFLDRVPAHAAVSTAVDAVRHRGAPWAAGFVNASLRAVARDAAAIRAETLPSGTASPRALGEWFSFPDWLVKRLGAAVGGDTARLAALLAALDEPAPLVLRATPRAGTREALVASLRAAELDAAPARFAGAAVVVKDARRPIPEIPGFAEGLFAVQDEAAQLVADLLDPREGEDVLDVCVAPGGKAIHAAQRGARVTGVDADARRLARVRENAERLGVTLELFAEAVEDRPIAALGDRRFAKVLVDAPCSGTGIIRRKPDVKWARTPGDLERLPPRQLAILGGAARHVAPGGRLVYAVCSLLPEEGERVVERFLAGEGGSGFTQEREALPPAFATADGFFRSDPAIHATDGFFAAVLRAAG